MPLLVGTQNIRTNRMVSVIIAEAAHGFSVGEPVSYDGTNWVKAKADSVVTGASGIVYEVPTADTFTFISRGSLSRSTGQWDTLAGTTGGLTPGSDYAVSQSTAGLYETTTPTSGIVQFMFRAISTTEVEVYTAAPRFNTAHAAINHDALVGDGLATVLSPGITPAELTAALADFKYVYLTPGQYAFGTTNFNMDVPEGHHLIGLSLGRTSSHSNNAYFQLAGTSQWFRMFNGSSIQNLAFHCTSVNTTSLIVGVATSGYRLLCKNLLFNANNVCQSRFIYATSQPMRVEGCVARDVPQTGNSPIIYVANTTQLGDAPWAGVYETQVHFSGSPTGLRTGIQANYADVIGCSVYRSGATGIIVSGIQSYRPRRVIGNYAYDCGSSTAYHGILVLSGGDQDWVSVLSNKTYACGGYGISLPTNRSVYYSISARGNYAAGANGLGAYFIGSAVLNSDNN